MFARLAKNPKIDRRRALVRPRRAFGTPYDHRTAGATNETRSQGRRPLVCRWRIDPATSKPVCCWLIDDVDVDRRSSRRLEAPPGRRPSARLIDSMPAKAA
jgi:hypothetical protein